MLLLSLAHPASVMIVEFARAGGGGSGGGGGGSGSGGGGGIILLGYVPAHGVGHWCKTHLALQLALFWTGLFAIAYAILLGVVFSSDPGLAFILVAAIAVGAGAGLFGWFDGVLKKVKLARKTIQTAAATDSVWAEDALHSRVRQVFFQYQADWSTFQIENITRYTTADYAEHVRLMLLGLRSLQRRNFVQDPALLDISLIDAQDSEDDAQDRFTARIVAKASDQLLDDRLGQTIYTDTSQFEEYWRFRRQGNDWMLEGIGQATVDAARLNPAVVAFAESQGLHYSPDWGWLLLPKRGVLFHQADFKRSDVNNHCIGLYHGLLVQFYTYIPVKTNKGSAITNYTIAQAALPKTYGNIIVRRKTWWSALWPAPAGYNKLSTEYNAFNKQYVVYATDVEQVTSFELLHPVFIERLASLRFEVNIEVVDNIVYLYTTDKAADYMTMMSITQAAFDELKL